MTARCLCMDAPPCLLPLPNAVFCFYPPPFPGILFTGSRWPHLIATTQLLRVGAVLGIHTAVAITALPHSVRDALRVSRRPMPIRVRSRGFLT